MSEIQFKEPQEATNKYVPGLRVIGVIEDEGKSVGYLVLNEQNLQYKPFTKQNLFNLMKIYPIKNFKFNGTDFECTECSINRLPKFDRNMNVTGNAGVTILGAIKSPSEPNKKGFLIVNGYGRVATASEDEILDSNIPLINAKAIRKADSRYISPILGSFAEIETPRPNKSEEDLKNYREFRKTLVRNKLITAYVLDFFISIFDSHPAKSSSVLSTFKNYYYSKDSRFNLFYGPKGKDLFKKVVFNEILPMVGVVGSDVLYSNNAPSNQYMFKIPEVCNFIMSNLDKQIPFGSGHVIKTTNYKELLSNIVNLRYTCEKYPYGTVTLRGCLEESYEIRNAYISGNMIPEFRAWYEKNIIRNLRDFISEPNNQRLLLYYYSIGNIADSLKKPVEEALKEELKKRRITFGCSEPNPYQYPPRKVRRKKKNIELTPTTFRKPSGANAIGLTVKREQDRENGLKFVGRDIENFDQYYRYSSCFGDLCAVANATIALKYEKWKEAEVIVTLMGIYNPELAKYFKEETSKLEYWGDSGSWKYGKADPKEIVERVKTFLPNFDYELSDFNIAPECRIYYESGFNVFYDKYEPSRLKDYRNIRSRFRSEEGNIPWGYDEEKWFDSYMIPGELLYTNLAPVVGVLSSSNLTIEDIKGSIGHLTFV